MSSIAGCFTWPVEFGRVFCTLEGIYYRSQLRSLICEAGTYSPFSAFLKAEDGVRHGE
jgi:hypothetical protein